MAAFQTPLMEPSCQPHASAPCYERHRPEATLLYQLVEHHYPAFVAELGAQGRSLPAYVQREFEDYLQCGRLEHGFLRVRCTACHAERLCRYIARPAALVPKPRVHLTRYHGVFATHRRWRTAVTAA